MKRLIVFGLLISVSGCAFFNTYFNARKAYNNGIHSIQSKKEQTRNQLTASDEITIYRFDPDPETISNDALQFFDVAIEKANKVVALHPDSRWVENAILLMGKAHYYRGTQNDYYDAKNRFEVYLAQDSPNKDMSEAKFWYAKTLVKLQMFDDAEQVLYDLTDTKDRNDYQCSAFLLLGDIQFSKGQLDESMQYYVKASTMASTFALKKNAYFKVGFSSFQLQKFDQALEYFRKLGKMDLEVAERFDVTLMTAQTMKLAGQYDQAIRLLDKIISNLRYKNFFIRAEFEIADILRLKGNYTEATEQFQYVIDTYKNNIFTGNAYYYMALMNDQEPKKRSDGFIPNPDQAKKYYYLVYTKYPQSPYKDASIARYQYLSKMETFKGFITADENLYKKILIKIDDPSTDISKLKESSIPDTAADGFDKIEDNVKKSIKTYRAVNTSNLTENFLTDTLTTLDSVFSLRDSILKKDSTSNWLTMLDIDSAALQQLVLEDSLVKAGFSKKSTLGAILSEKESKKEIEEIKLENKELQDKLTEVQNELIQINQMTELDGLQSKKSLVFDRIAYEYLSMADYFYYEDTRLDSALFYYQWVGEHFRETPSEEVALYSIARVHQKQKNPNWKYYFEFAFQKFPNGRMADVGMHILKLDTLNPNPFYDTFCRAEKSLIVEKDFYKAVSLYKQVAQSDTSNLKWSSLYAMGLLYEQKLDDPERAFRTYNTLVYAKPESEFAKILRPKIDAYIAKLSLSKDSMFTWIDTQFVKIKMHTDTTHILTTDSMTAIRLDSISNKKTIQTLDSAKTKRRIIEDEDSQDFKKKPKINKDKKPRDEVDKKDHTIEE
ncbi:tetratricopeptide repeat protein [bacterium]|nr:tetratricopeptide repeat protein [bacterium]